MNAHPPKQRVALAVSFVLGLLVGGVVATFFLKRFVG